jgi:hypothetical protein
MSFSLLGKNWRKALQDQRSESAKLDAEREKASLHLSGRSLLRGVEDCKEL